MVDKDKEFEELKQRKKNLHKKLSSLEDDLRFKVISESDHSNLKAQYQREISSVKTQMRILKNSSSRREMLEKRLRKLEDDQGLYSPEEYAKRYFAIEDELRILDGVAPKNKKVVKSKYAGFVRRFFASWLDGFILNLVFFVPYLLVYHWLPTTRVYTWALMFYSIVVLDLIIRVVGTWLYFAMFESSGKQATPGKLAFGIIVTDEQGRPVSFARASARFFGKYLSTLILYIGHIMIIFTKKKQGLHDILAGTLVIDKNAVETVKRDNDK